jgi:hypothetical protein
MGQIASAPEGAPLPKSLDELKALRRLARKDSARASDAPDAGALKARLDKMRGILERMRGAGRLPKAFLVYADGTDGAGKSSTTRDPVALLSVFLSFPVETQAFKAPPEQRHWLDRFRAAMPKPGQIMRWDRGPLGDDAYTSKDPVTRARMMKELNGLMDEMVAQGTLPINLLIAVDNAQRAAVFGKRWTYMRVGQLLIAAHRARGTLTPDIERALSREILGLNDLRAFRNAQAVQGRFLSFARQSRRVRIIYGGDRAQARLDVLDAFIAALEWYERSGAAQARPH